MKTKNMKKFLASVLSIVLVMTTGIPVVSAASSEKKDFERPERVSADTSFKGWLTVPENSVVASTKLSEEVTMKVGEEKTLEFDVPKKGTYAIALTYQMVDKTVLDSTVTVTQMDEGGETVKSVITKVYSLWQEFGKSGKNKILLWY